MTMNKTIRTAGLRNAMFGTLALVMLQLGCTQDQQVLEDSANGVLAGRAAGMRVWAFTGGSHCDDATAEPLLKAGAERVVCSWPDAADLFRQA